MKLINYLKNLLFSSCIMKNFISYLEITALSLDSLSQCTIALLRMPRSERGRIGAGLAYWEDNGRYGEGKWQF